MRKAFNVEEENGVCKSSSRALCPQSEQYSRSDSMPDQSWSAPCVETSLNSELFAVEAPGAGGEPPTRYQWPTCSDSSSAEMVFIVCSDSSRARGTGPLCSQDV